MRILSPKTNFLGGALVSASHLGKVLDKPVFTWNERSEFLKVNGVDQKLCYSDSYLGESLWCNDTCVDGGYYPEFKDQNDELYDFLSKHHTIFLCNHQPPSRYSEFLIHYLSKLQKSCDRIVLLNYRACWNEEFEFYCRPLLPHIEVMTLPYHYHLTDDLATFMEDPINNKKVAMIGRSNSRCKIQFKYDELKSEFDEANHTHINRHLVPSESEDKWELTSILPDNTKSNLEFLKELSKYRYILTGYFYGGEGLPELTVPYNKLEWSFMDALIAGCIPLTSSLFSEELKRMNIPAPTIEYNGFNGIHEITHKLYTTELNIHEKFNDARHKLFSEIYRGNDIIKRLFSEMP